MDEDTLLGRSATDVAGFIIPARFRMSIFQEDMRRQNNMTSISKLKRNEPDESEKNTLIRSLRPWKRFRAFHASAKNLSRFLKIFLKASPL